jgi:acyl dehydratase
VGEDLGHSEWLTITQETVDAFADATGDQQWIHVDTARAARDAPGGRTIAHGFLTLSLIASLQPSIYRLNASRIVNYGLNTLRFLNPVPVGSRIRQRESIASVEPSSGGLKVTTNVSIEIEGQQRPALVAELIVLCFE